MKYALISLWSVGSMMCSTSEKEQINIPARNGVHKLLKDTIHPETDSLEIRFGSSFGMCEGYCKYEYKLNSLGLECSRIGWDSVEYPKQHLTVAVSRTAYQNILRAVDTTSLWSEFNTIQIGCPDCADGGRCWIEVRHGHEVKRFDHDCMAGPGPHHALTEIIRVVGKDVRWWEPGDLFMPFEPKVGNTTLHQTQ